ISSPEAGGPSEGRTEESERGAAATRPPGTGATLTCGSAPAIDRAPVQIFWRWDKPARSKLSTRLVRIAPATPQDLLRSRAAAEIFSGRAKSHVFCRLTRYSSPGRVFEVPDCRNGPQDPIHARRRS